MTDTTYTFGPVTAADTDALIAMRMAFYQSQVDAGMLDIPLDPAAGIARTTSAIMRGGRSLCTVVRDGDVMVAYIYFVLRTVPGMEKGAIGSVEEIYVSPTASRQGLANQLVARAVADLRALNVDRIQARVIASNDPAVNFWEKEGFAQNVRILELPLDEA